MTNIKRTYVLSKECAVSLKNFNSLIFYVKVSVAEGDTFL